MDERERAIVGEVAARIESLSAGRVPDLLRPADPPPELLPLVDGVNRIIAFMGEVADFIMPLSRGQLDREVPRTRNFLASPFKELHSRLLHLTWQAEQVAKGDYSQRVDFMGDFSLAFNAMVEALEKKERQLTEKIDQLQHLNQLKNEFVGVAAHDLRSPIAVIEIYASFLLENARDRLNEKDLDLLAVISRQSHFMLRLLDDLLDVTKIESGNLQLEVREQDYAAFVREIADRQGDLAGRKAIGVRCLVPRSRLLLAFDANKIEQVLNNLIGNAIKFSPGRTQVTVRVSRDDDRVTTHVTDQGPGIPADDLPKLFNAFFKGTVKPTGGEKSTGLGLAISKRIIEGHGGRIGVESREGAGTTFWFTLPA